MTSLSKSVNELFAESGVLLYLLRYLDEPPFAEDIKPEKLTDASVYFYFFVVYFKTSLTNFFQEKCYDLVFKICSVEESDESHTVPTQSFHELLDFLGANVSVFSPSFFPFLSSPSSIRARIRSFLMVASMLLSVMLNLVRSSTSSYLPLKFWQEILL